MYFQITLSVPHKSTPQTFEKTRDMLTEYKWSLSAGLHEIHTQCRISYV